ncbi:hypothetical protein FKN16_17180 [Vibrio sp. 11-4(1)]|uniref:Uncharacterized protein n=1 Tax=Vibrio diabolicus TaxID=50719 RepID=A0AAX1XKI8_9VIBR|nr:hypothetical protein [Vibrio sp. 11-4(1)]PWF70286.1 hypothetical protein CBX98_19410 [Vibrio sp. T9]RPB37816.1 hypothetical protein CYQ91_14610 [Vibrio diabolicus]
MENPANKNVRFNSLDYLSGPFNINPKCQLTRTQTYLFKLIKTSIRHRLRRQKEEQVYCAI